jgi:hypothetical protein
MCCPVRLCPACFDFWREICHPAFSDVCNTIPQERTFRQRPFYEYRPSWKSACLQRAFLTIYKPCFGTLSRMLNSLNSRLWGLNPLLSTEAPAS